MSRVKRGRVRATKRKTFLRLTKGYRWGRKKKIKLAKTAIKKAGVYAYRDRKKKKSNFRALWQITINAILRKNGLTYSRFMGELKKKKIGLDRKILAILAENHPQIFAKLIEQVKK
ncbi:MAG: 50S ribosomal protein L20 [Candidatus Komeilibacteria bacterium RIFCSPLOWO2_01_FULL_45_10]|uniref:Large ribosomal subunit protein bL20 n=1 Tax=Candidatus Komeilibacteria bacterium RIFCSPLOWO2_01_FULL_45_10 TaxID=1798550 RepID=A0A1G2BLI7_9BACT|nr:MAG: 50S ribosomal protein L20 [Candidatus Komeilibacteria bacterium RIFCSPLOWO2_01_FULL_45_10]